jgi:hypothetical protein
MANKMENSVEKNTYAFFTFDQKNVDEILKKVDAYYRKNGRTIVGESN